MRKYLLNVNEKEYKAEIKELTADQAVVLVDDVEYKVRLVDIGRRLGNVRISGGGNAPAAAPAAAAAAPSAAVAVTSTAAPGTTEAIKAPLPGLIVELHVAANSPVKAGQNLLVMEAMKMENPVAAPYDGVVRAVKVAKGDSVAEGDVLLEISRT